MDGCILFSTCLNILLYVKKNGQMLKINFKVVKIIQGTGHGSQPWYQVS